MTTDERLPGRDASRRSQRIRRLTSLGRALTHVTRLEEVPSLIVSEGARLFEADKALLVTDDGDGTWEARAVHGLADRAFLWRQPAEDVTEAALQKAIGNLFREPFLAAPLVKRGQIFGLLAVSRPDDRPPSELDVWLLSSLADQAAVAMENVQLELETRRHEAEKPPGALDREESSKLVLDGVRHDLRAPISAIGLVCELLDGELLGPLNERQKEAVQDIKVSARHIESMALNLLDIGRLNAGVYEIEVKSEALSDIVEEAVAIVRPRAASREQTLEVAEASPCRVSVDSASLRKVLVNLLSNAVKYSPKRACTTIGYEPDPDVENAARIRVVDEGPGIPQEARESIFQPYYRLESKGGEGGVGLGLAICRELLHQMGGSIDLESEPGRGSTFIVRVRLASRGEEPAPAGAGAKDQ